MKKLISVFLFLIAFTIFSVIVLRTPNRVLYLLNWGEYIDHDLVSDFEKEYNCQVVEEIVTSSETMYQKIVSGTTSYDVAIPGDYCVRQLYKEGYLHELDVNNDDLINIKNHNVIFTDSLKEIMDLNMIVDNGNINTYYMPYFWGAYSIIYSKENSEVESVIKNNGFKALYNRDLYKTNVKIGMYNVARWIVSSYLMSENYNPNITDLNLNTTGDLKIDIQNKVTDALMNVNFDEFNDDALKRNVANGSLDMCFTQLGDFFDALYLAYESGNDINFNVEVPITTAAFFDSMVIPKTSTNYELANEFINFMLDPSNAYRNAKAIGYSPVLKEVCNKYNIDALNGEYYYKDENHELLLSDFLDRYPMYLNPLYNSTDVYLLEPKDTKYLTTCETIYNKISLLR